MIDSDRRPLLLLRNLSSVIRPFVQSTLPANLITQMFVSPSPIHITLITLYQQWFRG